MKDRLNAIKSFLVKKFETLYFFYGYMGNRLFLLLIFNFFMAFLDGMGLMMFVPLLQIADGAADVQGGDKLLGLVTTWFDYIGAPLNVYNMLMFIVLIFVFKAVARYFTQYYQVLTMQIFSKKIRKGLIDGLTSLSYKEFVSADMGRIQNSLTVEVQQVTSAGRQYIETIKSGMLVAVYLGFAFTIDWQFSILIVIAGGMTNFIYKRFYGRTKELSRKITKNNHRFGGALIESVNNFKYLKASGRNQDFGRRLNTELNDWISNNIKAGKLGAQLEAMREPMMVLIVCVVIAVQVSAFESSLSPIIVILLLFYRAMNYIMSLQTTWNAYLSSYGALENTKEFARYLSQYAESRNGNHRIGKIENLRLSEVEVSFGDFHVLKGISLEVPANQSVAFVGESGSGKSTLVNILCGVLEFDRGDYEVNGISLKDLDRNHFKSKVGYISQEPTIFNADIFDNVTFWAERTSENIRKFHEVMNQCSMRKFLESLPKGYEELLGHNGMNISGGQKQRISIARELFKGVELLIMDEATSALDSETEHEIKESLEALQGKLTIISIAHRLSTVRNADTIYLMDRGKIVASGNFEELKEQSEYFTKLAELQGL